MKRTLIGLMLQYLPPLRPIKGPSLDVTAALIERSLDIRNPRFLAPFHEQAGVKELKVAHEWGVRWQHGPDADEGYLVRPECYPKNMGPIWDPTADQCQGIQSTYATHNAAFVQVIDAPIGARDIRVEAQVAYYAPGSGAAATIGLDPTGQTDSILSETIDWADHWLDQDGGWEQETWGIVVHTIDWAEAGKISIWLRSTNRWRARNTHFWWRRALGSYQGEPGPGDLCQDKLDRILEMLERIDDRVAELHDQLIVTEEFEDLLVSPPEVLTRTREAAEGLIDKWRAERKGV